MSVRHARRGIAAAAGSAALALALAACGGGSAPGTEGAASPAPTSAAPSPDATGSAQAEGDPEALDLLARARTNLEAAESFRVTGEVRSGGQTVDLDMGFRPGEGATGTVAIGELATTLLSVGGEIYVQLTEEYLTAAGAPAAAQEQFLGKWVEVPAAQREQLGAFADEDAFVGEILEPTSGAVTLGPTGEIAGRPAQALLDGGQGRLWIATDGEPQVLRIESTGQYAGEFDVTYEPVELTEPPASQIVDPSDLGGGAT